MAIPGFEPAMQKLTELADAKAKDADETRRLLYMAIIAPHCKRYNLAGTLINALRHHHGIDPPGLERKIIDLVNGEVDEDMADRETWAREQIQRCTDILGK